MITDKGYNRIIDIRTGKQIMEHRLVWENHNGKIPKGYFIHHKDGNKLNNDINNLEILTPMEHKRKHRLGMKQDGIWYFICSQCKILKSEHDFYKMKQWLMSECKECHIKRAVRNKQAKTGV
jgi:hypothetical protein